MEVRVTGLESVINQQQRLLSLAPELGSQRREDTWEATWGSWRREKAGLGLEEEIEKERLDGKEERMEERDSMADLVLDRECNDMEGACFEVGVGVEDGVVGSE